MLPCRVLLVDDNPTFLHVAVRFLQQGTDIVVVGTVPGGSEALARAQALQPDVVLIDLLMPDTPGLAVIPRLRAALPALGIVALTLLDTDGQRRAALAAGADAFVAKATMITDLLPAIQRLRHVRPAADKDAP